MNDRIERVDAALAKQLSRSMALNATLKTRVDCAERALTRAGWTYTEGAEEWKPPLGPSALPLMDRIEALVALLREARQYVADAGCCDEDSETQRNSSYLLIEIDAALDPASQSFAGHSKDAGE